MQPTKPIPSEVRERIATPEQLKDGVTASDLMEQPGDFYFFKGAEWSKGQPGIALLCPFCNMPNALVKHVITQRTPLTVEPDVYCAYSQGHHFAIKDGKIIVI